MRTARDRRSFLLGGVGMLAGPALAQSNDHAIFSELSPDTKKMQPGWNRRIFTTVEARKGNAIQCDLATGIVTLAPGGYRLAGYSMVAYGPGGSPETTTIRAPAAAGYCRLRTFDPSETGTADLRAIANDDPRVVSIGSPATPNMTPSLFDGYHVAAQPTRIILEHQSGASPQDIYLRVFAQNSKWHAFARINIQRL